MKNKDLIVSHIQQDLKHHQLVLGLDNIGLQAGEKHHLELLNVVYDLMEVPQSVEMDSLRGCFAVGNDVHQLHEQSFDVSH